MKTSFWYVLLILPLILSCTNFRKAIYFDINQDLETKIQSFNNATVIQKNDLLSISVRSLSPEESAKYNAPAVQAGSGATAVPGGYLVNDDGRIQFPILGNIQAAGMTKVQLEDYLTKSLLDRKLLLDPLVNVRIINFRVTVLGEVTNPTVVNVPSEKINLLEAVGYAGDLTLFADRSNVLVIREDNGVRKFKMLNLNTNEIFSSPYFNLRHNDVIYVRPNRTKISNSSTARVWLPTVFSALSLAVIVLRYTN
jgi:polysaccharide biosynthesis/export protein